MPILRRALGPLTASEGCICSPPHHYTTTKGTVGASPPRNCFCLRLWPVSPHSLASPYDRLQFAFEGSCSHRSLHSRAVVSVVALRLERALAVAALVLRTREAQSSCVGRAAAFAASSHSSAFVSVVALRFERALATFGSSVLWQLVHCGPTREAQSSFVARVATFDASSLSTFGC